MQDGGGRGGGALPEHHEQEQGPLGAAHLCHQVGAARTPAPQPPVPACRAALGAAWAPGGETQGRVRALPCCGGFPGPGLQSLGSSQGPDSGGEASVLEQAFF